MRVEEPAAESFLHRLWEGQIAGKELRTVDGRRVEILSPGVRNFDSGPDYRGATVRIDGRLLTGDVEIHARVDDWNRHGHQRDPAYNTVILHVVTSGVPAGARTLRADGASVPIVDLDQHLPRPAEDLEQGQTTAPSPAAAEAPCPLAQAPLERRLAAIGEAAIQRLEMKAERFREERSLSDWEQVAYRALFEALGYSKNQAPARALADRMPVADLWRFAQHLSDAEALAHVQAWLLGASGLLDSVQDELEPPVAQFVDLQRSLWQAYPHRRKIDPLHPSDWRFFRLRPANFPTRRIAAMANLVTRHRQEGFVGTWTRILQLAPRLRSRVSRELEKTLTVQARGFWTQHDCFLTGRSFRSGKAPQLLGSERARDIVVNVVLPICLAYADEAEDGSLRTVVEEVYRSYPKLSQNEILRTMNRKLFGSSLRGSTAVRTAAQQQGLIQLYKFGCRLGDCSFCEGFLEAGPDKE